MSARILTAYLVSVGLAAGIISQALAKPPDLPAKVQINCEKCSDKLVLKTYQVADLVVPIENAPWPELVASSIAAPLLTVTANRLEENPCPARKLHAVISEARDIRRGDLSDGASQKRREPRCDENEPRLPRTIDHPPLMAPGQTVSFRYLRPSTKKSAPERIFRSIGACARVLDPK